MTLTILGGAFGAKEIILIVIAVVILFGGKKIPQLMRGVGEGIREFKKASRTEDEKPETQNPSRDTKE